MAADEDIINHPRHYTTGKFETIDVIDDWNLDYCLGNALKYISRADHKGNKEQDLRKAIWYLQHELGDHTKNNDTGADDKR